MNYLAHLFLSGNDEGLLVGNFVADGMRGTKISDYTEQVQRGIVLHREIDKFTDAHEMWRKSKDYLFPKYSHYAGVLVDMFYDYFLANNWNKFSQIPLQEFSNNCYHILDKNKAIYSHKSASFLRYMIRENALFNYQFDDKFEITLTHLSSRTKNNYHLEKSMVELKQYFTEFEKEFLLFFPELISYVENFIEQRSK